MKYAKKKYKYWIGFFSILVFTLIGTGLTFKYNSGNENMPKPDGKELWMYITEKHLYTDWDNWPGMHGMYEGQSPHGAYLKLYVNNIAKKAIEQGVKKMPADAIIVKENYNKQKNLVVITPLYKVEGYNPEAGDWFWAKYKKSGEIEAEGKVNSCIECHREVKSYDYLFNLSKMSNNE